MQTRKVRSLLVGDRRPQTVADHGVDRHAEEERFKAILEAYGMFTTTFYARLLADVRNVVHRHAVVVVVATNE